MTKDDDFLFVTLFQGALCLFLLEMGMTACKRLKDLRAAGVPFILFGILAPNVFATAGMFVAHGYSMALGQPFEIGHLRAVCGVVRSGLVHCRAGDPTTGDSGGEPHAAVGRLVGFDVFVQRDHWNSGLY